ncbi:hypothetical protein QVD17_00019 [Tagetes erecta]|uniref:Uncharacterized protein n=1 Tax=Tagetes erecta TaxID=13708 RepID=A0AAD8P5H1_TARER|nr:hypothetical protein QVD17_00019 [Tagetes erecta]
MKSTVAVVVNVKADFRTPKHDSFTQHTFMYNYDGEKTWRSGDDEEECDGETNNALEPKIVDLVVVASELEAKVRKLWVEEQIVDCEEEDAGLLGCFKLSTEEEEKEA